MIADTLENLSAYAESLPGLPEVIDFLKRTDLASLGIGKYPVGGGASYILIQEYLSKPAAEKKWESHRNYVDVQIVLSGVESMGYSPVSALRLKEAYNPEKDVAFHDGGEAAASEMIVRAGGFCVFFPRDAHRPGCSAGAESAVRKAVIKIPV